MIKKLIACTLIILLLIPSVVIAEPSNKVITDSDSVIINPNTVINIDGTKVIKGTVIRSINYRNTNIPFKQSELLALNISNILKTEGYNFGTVAVNEFTLNGTYTNDGYDATQKSGIKPSSKPEYLLGEDIMIQKDEYNFSSNVYTYTTVDSDCRLTYGEVIMMIYKGIGKSQYKHLFKHSSKGSSDIPIVDTPFLELVPNVFAAVDYRRYYTDVFSSRSNMEAYWEAAIADKLLCRDENMESEMTLSDFCYYLYTKMDREKEPVLTDAELEMLLVAHGRKLPIYLDSSKLTAVKHLIARGIVEADKDFSSLIDAETAALLISRAKVKETRLTFKNVNYPYIDSLVKEGYIPMDMELRKPLIEDVRIIPTGSAVTHFLDYYIERAEGTIFHPANDSGKIINEVYISSEWDKVSPNPYKGSSVEVVENGKYYHLKVPISIVEDSIAFKNNSFTINTPNESDSPENLKVAYGGGVYKWDGTNLVRSKFTSEFPNTLIDEERKVRAMTTNFSNTKLASIEREVLFKFKLRNESDLKAVLWDGKPISEAKDFSKSPDDTGNYSIKIVADDPYKYLLRHLTYTSDVAASELVRAYVADDRTALVSLKWLKKLGVVTGVTEIEEGKKWLIYGPQESTIIDLTNGIIVSGQTVTEIAKNDKSHYIVKDDLTGDMLIDFRAINNISSNYLMIKDSNGNISLSLSTLDYGFSSSAAYPLLGDGSQTVHNLDGDSSLISLENMYPTANWLVYKKRAGLENSEYLLVFRPDIKENAVSSKDMQEMTIAKFGLEEVKNVRINVYQIDMNTIYDDDNKTKEKNFILDDSSIEGPGVYYNSATSQYYYKVPEVQSLSEAYSKYMNTDYPMPLVYYEHMLVNLNLNIYDKSVKDLTKYPSVLKNGEIPNDEMQFTDKVNPNSFILAIAGVQSMYYPYALKSWVDISDNSSLFFGSMQAQLIKTEDDIYDINYKFITKNQVLASYPYYMAENDKPFTEVFRGSNNSIYVYGLDNKFRLSGFNPVTKESAFSGLLTFLENGTKSIFNWDAFSLAEWINGFDDGLTIVHYFILSIIPRLMLFIFIAFMVLSLSVENKLVVWIADKVVDPFKVLSFGLTSIEYVRTKNAWISIFIATVMLGMMSSGILGLVAWVVKFMQDILNM